MSSVLVYAFHGTVDWWTHIARNMGFEKSHVVTDLRGRGDYSVVEDFYAEYRRRRASAQPQPAYFSPAEQDDIVARCRVLRWLPRRQAEAMIDAMAYAFDRVLDATRPAAIAAFPIDCYLRDVLERRGKLRGIPYFELTASMVADQVMALYRGTLLMTGNAAADEAIAKTVHEVCDPLFVPTYAQVKKKYTLRRFFQVLGYFRLRAVAFKLISILKRDPLNYHYVDSLIFLGHKPAIADYQVVGLQDFTWRGKLAGFARERRIFFGLQLFPEASIDYWIAHRSLIDYEDVVVEAAQAFSAAGFQILVKDHPQQFGFRQRQLIQRLLQIPNVLFLPYEVSGNEVLSLVGANFTLTGTLGLQAALFGLKSVATPTWYVAPGRFITFAARGEVKDLPQRVLDWSPPGSLEDTQRAILARILEGFFPGDFFTFKGFKREAPPPSVAALAKEFGQFIRSSIARGKTGS